MEQRITAVQKEIVDDAAEKGQQMKTDNGCNEPTGEFSGCTSEFILSSRCFFSFSHLMKDMERFFFFLNTCFLILISERQQPGFISTTTLVIINLYNYSGQQ